MKLTTFGEIQLPGQTKLLSDEHHITITATLAAKQHGQRLDSSAIADHSHAAMVFSCLTKNYILCGLEFGLQSYI